MKIFHFATAAAVVAVGAFAAAAWAAGPGGKSKRAPNTPPGWSYELRDGKRVPRVPRKVNADGSWSEVVRKGSCTVTRTGREGMVREVRECD